MAATSSIVSKKLQVQVSTESNGKSVTKNINLNKIMVSATNDELYEAGKAVSELQTLPLADIRTIATNRLTESE